MSEANQNMICAYLSIALLVGLLANALAGWWWADPAPPLVIAAVRPRKVLSAGRMKVARTGAFEGFPALTPSRTARSPGCSVNQRTVPRHGPEAIGSRA